MATSFTITNLSDNTATAVTETTIASGTQYSLTAHAKDQDLAFLVQNDATTAASVIVKAGDYNNAGQGDLTCGVDATAKVLIGPLEGARFKQDDGTILIDSSCAGKMVAFEL